jgi:hypothetical protein
MRFVGTAQAAADSKLILEAQAEKLPNLFAYFQIDPASPNAFMSLALSLAAKHVPGFRYRTRQGAPRSIGLQTYCRLYRYVIAKIALAAQRRREGRPSDSQICKDLRNDPEFPIQFPELKDCSKGRLQNVLARARGMRRARVEHFVRFWFSKDASQSDEEISYFRSDSPLWLSEPTF